MAKTAVQEPGRRPPPSCPWCSEPRDPLAPPPFEALRVSRRRREDTRAPTACRAPRAAVAAAVCSGLSAELTSYEATHSGFNFQGIPDRPPHLVSDRCKKPVRWLQTAVRFPTAIRIAHAASSLGRHSPSHPQAASEAGAQTAAPGARRDPDYPLLAEAAGGHVRREQYLRFWLVADDGAAACRAHTRWRPRRNTVSIQRGTPSLINVLPVNAVARRPRRWPPPGRIIALVSVSVPAARLRGPLPTPGRRCCRPGRRRRHHHQPRCCRRSPRRCHRPCRRLRRPSSAPSPAAVANALLTALRVAVAAPPVTSTGGAPSSAAVAAAVTAVAFATQSAPLWRAQGGACCSGKGPTLRRVLRLRPRGAQSCARRRWTGMPPTRAAGD